MPARPESIAQPLPATPPFTSIMSVAGPPSVTFAAWDPVVAPGFYNVIWCRPCPASTMAQQMEAGRLPSTRCADGRAADASTFVPACPPR